MCFRIVRIEGDGSVKLIYAGDVSEGATNCNEVGTNTGVLVDNEESVIYAQYASDEGYYENGELKTELNTWYTTRFSLNEINDKIKNDKWCLGANYEYKYEPDTGLLIQDSTGYSEWNYASGNRVWTTKTTSLMCENEDYVESKYGTITSDEVLLAGGTFSSNTTYYLYENVKELEWWTLSNSYYAETDADYIIVVTDEGVNQYPLYDAFQVRPIITLIPGTTIVAGGTGTKTNPYVIN